MEIIDINSITQEIKNRNFIRENNFLPLLNEKKEIEHQINVLKEGKERDRISKIVPQIEQRFLVRERRKRNDNNWLPSNGFFSGYGRYIHFNQVAKRYLKIFQMV